MPLNVWESGADAGAKPSQPVGGSATGELPPVMSLFSATINDVMANFVGYLVAGLGLMLVTIVLTFVGIGLVYGLMFGGLAVGIALDDEAVASIGAIVGMFAGTFALIGLVSVVTGPMTASIYRAVWGNLTRQEPLTFGAPFSTAFTGLAGVLGVTVLTFTIVMFGALFCYLPGLVASLFLHMALPAVVVHGRGPVEAVAWSASHVRENLTWHLGAWGLGMVIMLVGSYIPLIGVAIAVPVYAAYTLRVYRAVAGD